MVTYWLMAKLNVGQQHEVDVRLVSGKIRAAIDTENRNDRIRGTPVLRLPPPPPPPSLIATYPGCFIACPLPPPLVSCRWWPVP